MCVFLQLQLFGLLLKVPLESVMGGSEKMNIKCVQLLCSGSLWILLHNPVRLVLTSDLHMSAREVTICLMSHFSKSGTCAHSCPTHCQPTNVAPFISCSGRQILYQLKAKMTLILPRTQLYSHVLRLHKTSLSPYNIFCFCACESSFHY